MTTLSERLYTLRKERNLTQQLAAEGMGIPFSTYRRYEKKEREPDASVLVQVVVKMFLVSTLLLPLFTPFIS